MQKYMQYIKKPYVFRERLPLLNMIKTPWVKGASHLTANEMSVAAEQNEPIIVQMEELNVFSESSERFMGISYLVYMKN